MRTATKSTDLISKKKKKKPTKKRKKKFAGALHLFVHFFAVVLHDYNAIVLND